MWNLFRAAAMVLLTATAFSVSARSTQTFEDTRSLVPGQTLTVRNQNGSIDVRAWDRHELAVVAVKTAQGSFWRDRDADLSLVEIELSEEADGVTLRTIVPRGMKNISVRYELRVPGKLNLDLETANGSVSVEDVVGDLELRTTNGKIEAKNVGGRVESETTNGSIDVELTEVAANADMSFETANGSVTLALPSDVSANLDAHTTNGSIQSDFPIMVQGKMRRTRVTGEINGGGGRIDLRTVNGSIRIRES